MKKTLELSSETMDALQQLTEITGAKNVGELIQDSLRVYEWIIYNQLQNFKIVPLTQEEISQLSLKEREILAALIDQRAIEKAKKYFDLAA